ncbi:MAG: alcohol dehydrogenase catalytic domain-containing protein [Candidatus Bathyarchaeia archaeon]
MKALVKEKPEPGLSLLEIERPRVENSDDVLFRVKYCGVCVGETKVYEWGEWAAADPTLELPTVLGHEVTGIIEEVGSGVKRFKAGDRITVDVMIFCGHCYQCLEGHSNMCVEREIYGKRRGAFAEYAVLPERVICKLPDRVSLEEGVLMENLGVAVHAVEQETHDPGDLAVVIGCGPIGILAAQTLTAYGVNVVLTDMVESRIKLAQKISGGTAINIKTEDPVKKIREMSKGKGADFVLEAAATQSALDQAFDIVRDRGTIVTIGTFNRPVTFNPFFKMTRRELRLISSIGRTWKTWRKMMQLINADKLTLKPLISHILPMEKYEEAFKLAMTPDAMKVALKF